MSTTHPSHSQPKCIDCKHLKHDQTWAADRCYSPLNGVDLVLGLPIAPRCSVMRGLNSECGEEGRRFEPIKPIKPITEQFQDWRDARKGIASADTQVSGMQIIEPHGTAAKE